MLAAATIFAILAFLIFVLAWAVGANAPSAARESAISVASWGVICAIVALILFLAWLLTPAAAHAQTLCFKLSDYLVFLKEKYREIPIGGGIVSDGVVHTVTASPEGTYSILVVTTRGQACLIASGTDWDPGRLPLAADKEG